MKSPRTCRSSSRRAAEDPTALRLSACVLTLLLGCAPATAGSARGRQGGPDQRPKVLYGPGGDIELGPPGDRRGRLCPQLAVDARNRLFIGGQIDLVEVLDTARVSGGYVGLLREEGGVAWVTSSRDLEGVCLGAGADGFVLGARARRPVVVGGVSMGPGAVIARFDPRGAVVWARSAGDDLDVARVLVDGRGNVVVLSQRGSPGNGTRGAPEVHVARYSPEGGLLWDRKFPGWLGSDGENDHDPGDGDRFAALAGDTTYVWLFPCDGARCSRTAAVVRLAATGTETWVRRVPAEPRGEEPFAMHAPHLATDADANLYVAGNFTGELASGIVARPRDGYSQGFGGYFLKIDARGERVFLEGFDSDQAGLFIDGLTVDSAGRPWITGSFFRFVDLGANDLELHRPSARGVADPWLVQFVAMFDGGGRARFSTRVGWGSARAIASWGSKGVVVTSSYRGDLLLDGVLGAKRYGASYGCAVIQVPGPAFVK